MQYKYIQCYVLIDNNQVFIDNTIASGKEGQYMSNEMSFVGIQSIPMFQVLAQVNFFHGPKRGFSLLVHLPNVLGAEGRGLIYI